MTIRLVRASQVKPRRRVTRCYRRRREVALFDRQGIYGRYGYRVDLDRCKTAADPLARVLHLCDKCWVTPQHLQELIEHAERENGIRINYTA